MGKMELEVKVLDIDEAVFRKKIESLGGIFKEETKQILYTYDLPTIYGRFVDIRLQLTSPESQIKYDTAVEKLRLLFFEVDNLLSKEEKAQLQKITGYTSLEPLLEDTSFLSIITTEAFEKFMMSFRNNPKKWIRVRQTNDVTTIAVKHILADNHSHLQQMMENELEVASIHQANSLLEALGFSYKSYQEKRRVTYLLDQHEIDIDTWPGIPTYFEVEGTDEEDLMQILDRLGYTLSQTVSCTADQVYEKYGKTMFAKRELQFKDYE